MNELREVVEMVTKQAEPSPDSWKEQERRQRRTTRGRKLGAIGLVAALIAGVVVFAVTNLGADKGGTPAHTGPPATRQGPLGLAIVGLDGTVQQDLGLPTDAWMADLSSDGRRILFLTGSTEVGFCGGCSAANPPNDRLATVLVGKSSGSFIYLEGIQIRRMEEPAWSPDGNRIAFVGVARGDGNRDIYVANLEDQRQLPEGIIGGTAQRLTFDPAVDEFPAWSPDGSTILFDNLGAEPVDDSGFSSTQEIWSVPADGGAPQRLTNNDVADAQPDVAGDGTVAFWRVGEIWTMNQQGGSQQQLEVVPGETGFNPRWSPDGSMMALLRFDDTSGRASIDARPWLEPDLPLLEVVVVDLATGDVTTVGPRVVADFNPVSWMPDGSALLIDRYDAGG
jgi:Tol biopolymer transport system component